MSFTQSSRGPRLCESAAMSPATRCLVSSETPRAVGLMCSPILAHHTPEINNLTGDESAPRGGEEVDDVDHVLDRAEFGDRLACQECVHLCLWHALYQVSGSRHRAYRVDCDARGPEL